MGRWYAVPSAKRNATQHLLQIEEALHRLLEPGSEFRVHRHWFTESAVEELLEEDFAVAEKDRLYRCLDRIVEHKREMFPWLQHKWAELFHFAVLLYDLISTYFEGEMEECGKAKRG